MATDDTTRTPTMQDGDAGVHTPTTDPTSPEGRTDQPAADKAKQDALANKVKAEKYNALMQRLGVETDEELTERLTQPPAAPAPSYSPPAADDHETRRAERAAKIAELKAEAVRYARQGDAVAALQLEQEARIEMLEQRDEDLARSTADAFALSRISDPKLRQRIKEHYDRNGHRLGDIRAAAAEVLGEMRERENQQLRERLATFEKQPDPDVRNAPPTAGRELSATETQTMKRMRRSDFDAQVAAFEAQDNFAAARKLRQQLLDDKIEVDWNS